MTEEEKEQSTEFSKEELEEILNQNQILMDLQSLRDEASYRYQLLNLEKKKVLLLEQNSEIMKEILKTLEKMTKEKMMEFLEKTELESSSRVTKKP